MLEPRAFTLNYIPSSLVFIWGFMKSLSCPYQAWTSDNSAIASQSAGVIFILFLNQCLLSSHWPSVACGPCYRGHFLKIPAVSSAFTLCNAQPALLGHFSSLFLLPVSFLHLSPFEYLCSIYCLLFPLECVLPRVRDFPLITAVSPVSGTELGL